MSEIETIIQIMVTRAVSEQLRSAALSPRGLRIKHGCTAENLAHASGVSKSALSKIESGKVSNPQIETLNKLARALGIPEQEYRAAVGRMAR